MAEKEKPQTSELAGRNEWGSSKFDDRLSNLANRRKQTKEFLDWLREQDNSGREDVQKAASKMATCATWLKFNNYYTVDQIRLAAATSCDKHLLCSFCAARRGSKYLQKYLERFTQVIQKNPGLKPAMLTLTTKNGSDLEERFKHLLKSLRSLLKKRRNATKGNTRTELLKAVGGVYSIEVTNKGNGWHVHVHALVLLSSKICRETLSREWEKITRDGSKILDIRLIKGGLEPFDHNGEVNPQLVESFAEVFKYAVKFSDLDHSDRLFAWEIMRGKRLVGSWGELWGVQVPEGAEDELLDDLPYLEMIYRFTGSAYSLHKTKSVSLTEGVTP